MLTFFTFVILINFVNFINLYNLGNLPILANLEYLTESFFVNNQNGNIDIKFY